MNQQLLDDQWLDRGVLCRTLSIHPSTAYRMIARGQLPKPIKVGGSSRWLRSEVEQALASMERNR
jgi:predicted DNA-binding transcriptional regulator AlpA